MKNENLETKEFIPPNFYSLDGLYEIINTLENSPEIKEFSGPAFWATRKEGKVVIDKNFIEKLIITAGHYKNGLGEDEYHEILVRISNLEQRIKQ
ncbi:MAG: hypothetical protein NTX00_03895 [Candidatus Parcubacteria bacterium]|nr:hypothetical protein [Candidatus Parcubacteria bacterium]